MKDLIQRLDEDTLTEGVTRSVIFDVIDKSEFFRLLQDLKKDDPEGAKLLKQVFDSLKSALQISDAHAKALLRFKKVVDGRKSLKDKEIKNSVAFAAHSLGLKEI